ncbi:zinc finger protein 862-like [Gadus chalcogrammus]|uniref:zinc finger protein 862-like n=1 Tax=Gadus chalcogrammus TaxID=1042646 RepID=UPI0024C4A6B9|nr:zinc finger protein 862-like [Gadus chalcogrammus]
MGADGAAVNLGHKGGVIALLQQEAGDFIVPFHCMPHRLELAMLSVQRDNAMIGQVYDMLNMVWKTYHFSPKSMRELKALGEDLGVNVLVPSGVRGTRWLPHVSRALETLLRPGKDNHGQFTAVYCHMDHLAGSSANADIAGRARKIKKTMGDGTFVAFCHFLADVFSGLTKFSLLQKNEIILPQAVCGLQNLLATTEVMEARPKPGGRLSQLQDALRQQKRQQEEQGEIPNYKFQVKY